MSDGNDDSLGAIDHSAVEQRWQQFASARQIPPGVAPADVFQFGDSAEMADRLLALVVDGPKRATASCRLDYADDGSDLPTVGDFSIICDGRGLPRGVIETTDVRVGPLSSVDDAFAWDEGEGDRTRGDWLRMHSDYFERMLGPVWLQFGDGLAVVFERFDVVDDGACREPETAR